MRIDKDNIKIILILLVVCLGIGYSYLNTEHRTKYKWNC